MVGFASLHTKVNNAYCLCIKLLLSGFKGEFLFAKVFFSLHTPSMFLHDGRVMKIIKGELCILIIRTSSATY